MKAEDVKAGIRVHCNGYNGTIVRVCAWSLRQRGGDVLVEVRLPRGYVCVPASVLGPPKDIR